MATTKDLKQQENRKKALTLYKELASAYSTDKTKFIELLKSESPDFYLMNLPEKNIIKLPKIALKYLATKLDEFIDENHFRLPFEYDVIEDKKYAILKICLVSPEHSYNAMRELITLHKIKMQDVESFFSKEAISRLPERILDVLNNPLDNWKIADSPVYVLENIVEGQEYEALEYFSKHDPKLFKSLLKFRTLNSPYSRKKVVEHYENVDKSQIPEPIKEFLVEAKAYLDYHKQIAIENGAKLRQKFKDKRGQFVDKNGNFLKLFTLKNDLIKSKEDYYRIAEIFKESGLSVIAFCRKYGIMEVEGFREMIDRVAEQKPEFAEYYNEFTDQKSKEFITKSNKIISGILNKTMSVGEAITTPLESKYLVKFIELCDYFFENKYTTGKLLSEIINYYHKRLNSFDDNSLEPADLKKRLTTDEVLFLSNRKGIGIIRSGGSYDIADVLHYIISERKAEITSEAFTNFYNKTTGIAEKLSPYFSLFDRYKYTKIAFFEYWRKTMRFSRLIDLKDKTGCEPITVHPIKINIIKKVKRFLIIITSCFFNIPIYKDIERMTKKIE